MLSYSKNTAKLRNLNDDGKRCDQAPPPPPNRSQKKTIYMSEAQGQLRLSQEDEAEVGLVYVCLPAFRLICKVSESQGRHIPTILILSCPHGDDLAAKNFFH